MKVLVTRGLGFIGSNVVASPNRARELLGFEALVPFAAGVTEFATAVLREAVLSAPGRFVDRRGNGRSLTLGRVACHPAGRSDDPDGR
jgi:hypothetical protein